MIKPKKRKILYLGDDQTFLDDLQDIDAALYERNPTKIITLKFDKKWNEKFEKVVLSELPHLIYLDLADFSSKDSSYPVLLQQLLLIKKHATLKSALICVLFGDSTQLIKHQAFFSVGVLYSYVKQDSHRSLLEDTYFIAFNEQIAFKRYAIAKQLKLNYELSSMASVTKLSSESLTVESDLDFELDSNTFIEFKLSNDTIIRDVRVDKIVPRAEKFNFLNTTEFKINYPGPWDEIEEDSIQMDTVETWISMNENKYPLKKVKALIINSEAEFIFQLKGMFYEGEAEIIYEQFMDKDFELLTYLRPQIIFYSFDDDVEGEEVLNGANLTNSIQTMVQLISFTKTMGNYEPLIVAFNSPSGSSALAKAMGYPKIASNPKEIDLLTAQSLIDLYITKGKSSEMVPTSFFNPQDSIRNIEIKRDVIITSLTEHELTFVSENDYPLFSIIKIYEPCELFLIIVPPVRELEVFPNGMHYMGFIHGASEFQLQLVRRFVNQLLEEAPKEFKFIDSKVPEDKKFEKPQEIDTKVEIKKVDENRKNIDRDLGEGIKSKL